MGFFCLVFFVSILGFQVIVGWFGLILIFIQQVKYL